MNDPKETPRQGGYSETPEYETNPRKWARQRCINAVNNLDKVALYMGELIQVYRQTDDNPEDTIRLASEMLNHLEETQTSITAFVTAYKRLDADKQVIGRYPEVILPATIILQAAIALQDSIMDLRSGI